MAIPEPHPGLVISYSYLWWQKHRRGIEEGRKDRPAVIVVARRLEAAHTVVTVVPITHTRPADPTTSIEIPAPTKHRLGLDATRSWVILEETNDFLWPGPDVRPKAGGRTGDIAYGHLPPNLYKTIRERILKLHAEGKLQRVRRTT